MFHDRQLIPRSDFHLYQDYEICMTGIQELMQVKRTLWERIKDRPRANWHGAWYCLQDAAKKLSTAWYDVRPRGLSRDKKFVKNPDYPPPGFCIVDTDRRRIEMRYDEYLKHEREQWDGTFNELFR